LSQYFRYVFPFFLFQVFRNADRPLFSAQAQGDFFSSRGECGSPSILSFFFFPGSFAQRNGWLFFSLSSSAAGEGKQQAQCVFFFLFLEERSSLSNTSPVRLLPRLAEYYIRRSNFFFFFFFFFLPSLRLRHVPYFLPPY